MRVLVGYAAVPGLVVMIAGERGRTILADTFVNAAVAICAAELGVSCAQIQHGLATFSGVKRRMEVRGSVDGGPIHFPDSACTRAGNTVAADASAPSATLAPKAFAICTQ